MLRTVSPYFSRAWGFFLFQQVWFKPTMVFQVSCDCVNLGRTHTHTHTQQPVLTACFWLALWSTWVHFILTASLLDRYYYHPHFVDEDTMLRKLNDLLQSLPPPDSQTPERAGAPWCLAGCELSLHKGKKGQLLGFPESLPDPCEGKWPRGQVTMNITLKHHKRREDNSKM